MTVNGGAAVNVEFCLAFQREALSVPVTRSVLGDILRTVGVDDDSISDILLAATEACSNVLRHGGPRATGYAVVVSIAANRCEVEVAEDWSFAGTTVADVPRRAAGPGGQRLSGGRRRARGPRAARPRRARRAGRPRAAARRGEAPLRTSWACPNRAAGWTSCGPAWTT
jgi:hypothetical protein